jgi:ATP-dependent Clp protease ATP-binding subunit ClpA
MHERFSDRARHAMALANREAVQLGHGDIGPEHILLGLLAERESVGTCVLKNLDVNLDRVRLSVSKSVGPGEESTLGRRPHSRQTRDVIDFSIEEARKLGHRHVGTEHLLLGLMRHRDNGAARALEQERVGLDALREELLATLRREVDATHDVTQLKHGVFEWMHQEELAKAFRSSSFWHTLILAVDSANRLGHGEIEPVHLLLGLLRQPDGSVAGLLAEKDVTVDWVREKVAARVSSD